MEDESFDKPRSQHLFFDEVDLILTAGRHFNCHFDQHCSHDLQRDLIDDESDNLDLD